MLTVPWIWRAMSTNGLPIGTTPCTTRALRLVIHLARQPAAPGSSDLLLFVAPPTNRFLTRILTARLPIIVPILVFGVWSKIRVTLRRLADWRQYWRARILASVVQTCPVISIDVQTTACRYGGGAVVTFNNDHSEDPNASFGGIVGCTLLSGQPGSYPLSYECKRASTAVMGSSCTFSGLATFACDSHYAPDSASGSCRWDGDLTAGTDCPAGEFYDPVSHCSAVSSGDLADYPACPPGTDFTRTAPGAYACFPGGSAGHVPSQSKSINPPICPNACQLSVDQCSVRNLVFCPTTCACLSVGVKCPTH